MLCYQRMGAAYAAIGEKSGALKHLCSCPTLPDHRGVHADTAPSRDGPAGGGRLRLQCSDAADESRGAAEHDAAKTTTAVRVTAE